MLRDEISKVLSEYNESVQVIIAEVLAVEQENIAWKNPRVKDDIDLIIDRAAQSDLDKEHD